MAVKPKDSSDTFLREVDEELRRERVNNFVTQYGKWLIGGAIALLAVVGGWIWWQHRQTVQAGELSEKLVQAEKQVAENNAKGAAATIDELVASDRVAYRISGLFLRANAQISTNAIPAAIETLKTIVNDGEAPQPYRDAALVRQTQLEYDNLPPDQVVQRLQPLAQPGNAWHGTAGEMLAVALMRQNKHQEAGRIFEAIARDRSVPESVRARAIQMASALGIDAVQIDPTLAETPAAGSAPAGAPGTATGAPPAQPKQ